MESTGGAGSGGQGETLFQALPSPLSLPPESPLQQLREEGASASPPWRSLPLGSPIRLHASSPSSPCAHVLPRTLRTAPLLLSFGHEAPGRGQYLQAQGRGTAGATGVRLRGDEAPGRVWSVVALPPSPSLLDPLPDTRSLSQQRASGGCLLGHCPGT